MNFKLNNQTIFGLVSEKVKVSNYHENLPMQNTEKNQQKKLKLSLKEKNRYFNKEILPEGTRKNRDETHTCNLHVSNKKWGLRFKWV